MKINSEKVQKKILSNGLTILVKTTSLIPKVSIQLWYNVGSKDEQTGEKGIAHLIEHMIFKGTNELSESDINLITAKLSGYANAFTSYDYTGYLFDFPTQNWKETLPIMSDCMKNCTFKQDLLNSELKAVIQELRMYKDNYFSSLIEGLTNAIFVGHPYQHPIIGYKQDLWNLSRQNLVNFYKKHYVPNNATLVIVGDVSSDEVFKEVENNFGEIEPNLSYKKEEFYLSRDLSTKGLTLYRDISQPMISMVYSIPGVKDKVDYQVDTLTWLLGAGRGSRLYKILIDEKQLVTDLKINLEDLFEKSLFIICFTPKDIEKKDQIIEIIKNEIEDLAINGPNKKELQRATKKLESDFLTLFENNQSQAYALGKFYLANGDENYIYNYLEGNTPDLSEKIKILLKENFHPSMMNIGQVLPLSEKDRELWLKLQELSEQEDEKILSKKTREVELESGLKVNSIEAKDPVKFNYPQYESLVLNNGLEVLFYNNETLPKIDLIIDMKSKYYYDPENLSGLNNFTSDMLIEGTNRFTAEELSNEIESLGMSLDIAPGTISMSMLSNDFKRGLELITEILTNPKFEEESIEKVRKIIISDIKNYWDNPMQFASQLAREKIYKNHPYRKNPLGTLEDVSKITKKDIQQFFSKFISPRGARIAIVGDLTKYDLKKILTETIEKWQGPEIPDLSFVNLESITPETINYKINRDQIVLAFAGLSIKRKDPTFDKLLLFDQIFCGGVLGVMGSRLFQVREQTGLFYTIGGSLLMNSDDQPGLVFIKTLVSNDRLTEAQKLIKEAINHATEDVTRDEFDRAQNGLINSLVDNFSSNRSIASVFLFLRRYDFNKNFFDNRANELLRVSIKDMQQEAKKVLDTKKMIEIKIGRV